MAPRRQEATIARASEVLTILRGMADPARLAGMARYGIRTESALGVTVTELRSIARTLGRDHDLAAALWNSGIHEARILATMVDDPALVTDAQMEAWVTGFDSWDLCDQACGNLFDRTPYLIEKVRAWSVREEEFVRRAAFALVATAAVHRKDLPDEHIERLLPVAERAAGDDRVYVRKAVSWALRQAGKRSPALHAAAVREAERIGAKHTRSSRWIASDVLRELRSDAVLRRLGIDGGGAQSSSRAGASSRRSSDPTSA